MVTNMIANHSFLLFIGICIEPVTQINDFQKDIVTCHITILCIKMRNISSIEIFNHENIMKFNYLSKYLLPFPNQKCLKIKCFKLFHKHVGSRPIIFRPQEYQLNYTRDNF